MPSALTLTVKMAGSLDESKPHIGLYPRVGLYPNSGGLVAHTSGVLTATVKTPGTLTLTPNT